MPYTTHTRTIQRQQRGFTLVETFVAVTILLLATVGPMTIAARGLQSSFFSKQQITAFYLGQEAIELVKAQQYENVIAGNDWLAGLETGADEFCHIDGLGCGIDTHNETFIDCAGEGCRILYDTSASRGFYQHAIGENTPFTRRIFIEETEPAQEAEITVLVSWDSGLFVSERTLTLRSALFNAYE